MSAAQLDVRNAEGERIPLEIGAWYVGVNISEDAPMIPAPNWHWGAGEIAQYVGEDCFWDEGEADECRLQDYDYIVFSHTGKASA